MRWESDELRELGERGVEDWVELDIRHGVDGGGGVSGDRRWQPSFGGWRLKRPRTGWRSEAGESGCRRVVERARRGLSEGPGSWPRWGSL